MNLRSLSPLQLALGVSVALHAALLTVRFVDPQASEETVKGIKRYMAENNLNNINELKGKLLV